MSTASARMSQRRFTVLFDPRDAARERAKDHQADRHPVKRPTLTRCGSDGNSESGPATPNPEDRREGFTWDIPEEESGDPNLRRTSATEPKGSANPSKISQQRVNLDITNPTRMERLTPLIRRTSSNLFERGFTRHETVDSFSSIRRQGRRAVPDIGVFNPGDTHKPPTPREENPSKVSKLGRNLTFMVPVLKKRNSTDSRMSKASRKGSGLGMRDAKPKDGSTHKLGLKDRRKLGQTEAMKLTLPMELPNLPARSRSPISETVLLSDIARPRRGSPTTPWVRHPPPAWVAADESGARPPTIIVQGSPEIDKSVQGQGLAPGSDPRHCAISTPKSTPKPLRGVGQWRGNRPPFNRREHYTGTPDADPTSAQDHPRDTPETPSKRSRHWLWSGPWTSNDLSCVDTPSRQLSPRPSSHLLSRMFRKPPQNAPPITFTGASTPTSQQSLAKPRKNASKSPSSKHKSIASMPVPPVFIPPGVKRVPTPPMFQQNGEVKGKLADFFFDQPGLELDMGPVHKPHSPLKPSPGLSAGVWDSDALLMSQKSEITPSDSDSHDRDSPTRLSAILDPGPPPTPANYASLSATGYVYTQFPGSSPRHPRSAPPIPEAPGSHADFFRVELDPDDDGKEREMSVEERAKLEWVLPEHLPSSPLCPLHVKYRGISVGLCPWHGRKKKSVGEGRGRVGGGGSGAGAGLLDASGSASPPGTPVSEAVGERGRAKKRRLVSLSGP